jgi:hypothetical protein
VFIFVRTVRLTRDTEICLGFFLSTYSMLSLGGTVVVLQISFSRPEELWLVWHVAEKSVLVLVILRELVKAKFDNVSSVNLFCWECQSCWDECLCVAGCHVKRASCQ